MSVISFPRRIDSAPTRHRTPRQTVTTPRRQTSTRSIRFESATTTTPYRVWAKSIGVLVFALVIVAVGALENAQRQVKLHNDQTEILNLESSYAVQLGAVSNLSAPNVIASNAANLHLVEPTSVHQIAAVSVTTPLPTPTFATPVTVMPRTSR